MQNKLTSFPTAIRKYIQIRSLSRGQLKKIFYAFMVICLLISSFVLARKAAQVSHANHSHTVRPDNSDALLDSSQNSNNSSAISEKISIVIDAGHGGNDPGKIGVHGEMEKNINLDIAKKLAQKLKKQQIHVVPTRTSDICLAPEESSSKKRIDLQNRIDIIKKTAPILSVSIHQNSFPNSSVNGPQVFYYSNSENGKKLAATVQNSLNAAARPDHPRSMKSNSSYYLLRHSPCPTIIVECGFLSNPDEAAKLTSDNYQDLTADSICRGILQYLQMTVPS